jgi:3-hydroxyacyl-CoA dehydrogenase
MSPRSRMANDLVLQGPSPEAIDKVIFDYGFAVGPFQMSDIVGLDVVGRDSKERTLQSDMLAAGRFGQKKGGGFYDYDEARNASPSAQAKEIIAAYAAYRGIKQTPDMSPDEILGRLLYPVVNEGAKALEERVAAKASDIDIACIYGYNWPVYTGGPMHWADHVGLKTIVAKLRAWRAETGDAAFEPAPLLVRFAEEGKKLQGYAPG